MRLSAGLNFGKDLSRRFDTHSTCGPFAQSAAAAQSSPLNFDGGNPL